MTTAAFFPFVCTNSSRLDLLFAINAGKQKLAVPKEFMIPEKFVTQRSSSLEMSTYLTSKKTGMYLDLIKNLTEYKKRVLDGIPVIHGDQSAIDEVIADNDNAKAHDHKVFTALCKYVCIRDAEYIAYEMHLDSMKISEAMLGLELKLKSSNLTDYTLNIMLAVMRWEDFPELNQLLVSFHKIQVLLYMAYYHGLVNEEKSMQQVIEELADMWKAKTNADQARYNEVQQRRRAEEDATRAEWEASLSDAMRRLQA